MSEYKITSIEIVSPFGLTFEDHYKNKDIYFHDDFDNNLKYSKISNINYESMLGSKGLRLYDPSSLLISFAVQSMLKKSDILKRYKSEEVCLTLGSDIPAHLQNLLTKSILSDPLYEPSPGLIPNMSSNAIAGQLAIRFGIKGENITISNSETSFWDAFDYAADKVSRGQEKIFLVCGGESITEEILKKYRYLKYTSPVQNVSEMAVALIIENSISQNPQILDLNELKRTIVNIQEKIGIVFGFAVDNL